MNNPEKKVPLKAIVIGAAILLVIAAVIVFCGRSKKRLPEVNVTTVSRGDISQELDATGRIESENTLTYYSKVSGIVLDCNYKRGDLVKKGDKLLTYDTSDLETELSKARVSGEITELDITDAEGFNGRKSDRYDEAQAAMNERIVWLESRKADLDRYQEKLIREQASDEPDQKKISRLQFDIEEAKTDIQSINQQLTAATQTRDAAKEALLSNENHKKLVLADEISDISVTDIEDDLETAKKGIDVEFDGVITETFVKSGAAVAKGQPLLTIDSAENVSVKLEIGKKDLSGISVGQKAVIDLVSYKYEGTVVRISHAADTDSKNKQVVPVYVRIDNPDENIIIDMEAKAHITLGEAKNVLIIPSESLHEDEDGSFCYVVENGVVKRRQVTTAVVSNGKAEVKEGLSEGETVLLSLPDNVSEGDMVTAVKGIL